MEREVVIPVESLRLEGSLAMPHGDSGIVLFAHGSGSSRHSPRNRFVAARLQEAGFGTLLFDLLTPEEDQVYSNRFDIERLAVRLELASQWLLSTIGPLPLGFFGASTGAAAALRAAARMENLVGAVVSRGGRPDLAGEDLGKVAAPTLLIVGELDDVVLALNRAALDLLSCPKRLSLVRGATHLFGEPGALDEAARLAAEWFEGYLSPGGRAGAEPRSESAG